MRTPHEDLKRPAELKGIGLLRFAVQKMLHHDFREDREELDDWSTDPGSEKSASSAGSALYHTVQRLLETHRNPRAAEAARGGGGGAGTGRELSTMLEEQGWDQFVRFIDSPEGEHLIFSIFTRAESDIDGAVRELCEMLEGNWTERDIDKKLLQLSRNVGREARFSPLLLLLLLMLSLRRITCSFQTSCDARLNSIQSAGAVLRTDSLLQRSQWPLCASAANTQAEDMVQNLADASYESARVLLRDKRHQEARDLAALEQHRLKEMAVAAEKAKQQVARVKEEAEARAEALMLSTLQRRAESPPQRPGSPPRAATAAAASTSGRVQPAMAPVRPRRRRAPLAACFRYVLWLGRDGGLTFVSLAPPALCLPAGNHAGVAVHAR